MVYGDFSERVTRINYLYRALFILRNQFVYSFCNYFCMLVHTALFTNHIRFFCQRADASLHLLSPFYFFI